MSAPCAGGERLLALDAFRGFAIASMLLVNNPGDWSALYAPTKTPHDVLETLHRATVQALKTEAVQSTFSKQMINAVPDASMADAQAWNKRETERWKELTGRVKVDHPQ